MLVVAVFVAFSLWMGFSRFGDVTLGQDDEELEFSLMAWFSMLFAAGMGIGLVFWGAAEPLTFSETPKPGVSGGGAELAEMANGPGVSALGVPRLVDLRRRGSHPGVLHPPQGAPGLHPVGAGAAARCGTG